MDGNEYFVFYFKFFLELFVLIKVKKYSKLVRSEVWFYYIEG